LGLKGQENCLRVAGGWTMDGRRMAGEWQENGRRMAENGQRMAGGWPEGELEAEAVLEDSRRWFELFCIASGPGRRQA